MKLGWLSLGWLIQGWLIKGCAKPWLDLVRLPVRPSQPQWLGLALCLSIVCPWDRERGLLST